MSSDGRLARRQIPRGSGQRDGPGISPEDIADHNSRATLALLLRHGPLTRQELSGQLGLTEPAVTGILKRLAGAGLVQQGRRESGDKAARFSPLVDGAYGLGLWLSPDGGRAAVVDLSGRAIHTQAFAADGLEAAIEDCLAVAPDRLMGVGIAQHPDCRLDEDRFAKLLAGMPVFFVRDVEAAVAGERMLGIGEPEGGFAVLLIDEKIRAGLLAGGRFFRGTHGRAGDIGQMRPARGEPSLEDVASVRAYETCLAEHGESAIDAWMQQAASRLLDAVLAIAGFVSPGAILIGGNLPRAVLEGLVEHMLADRDKKGSYFVAAPWIPPIRPLSLGYDDLALGAGLLPLMERLLPKQA